LLFEIKGDATPFVRIVELNLDKVEARSPQDLCNRTHLPYNSIKRAISMLRKDGKIEKVSQSYPVKWVLKEMSL